MGSVSKLGLEGQIVIEGYFDVGGESMGDIGYQVDAFVSENALMIKKKTWVHDKTQVERMVVCKHEAIQLARAILKHYGEQ